MSEDLLLEIGCEEIPSRFLKQAIEQLKEQAALLLSENRLDYGSVQSWATPRRLVLLVEQLSPRQRDLREKVKGPARDRAYDREGKPTKALLGFARSHGVDLESITVERTKDVDYVVAVKETASLPAQELLPGLLEKIIKNLYFPKPMYWYSREIRFARPIRWLLALYGDRPVEFEYAGIRSGTVTYRHRFLAPGAVAVKNPAAYFALLKEGYVILDQNERCDLVRRQVEEAAAKLGGRAVIQEALLQEVSFLVEYPVAVSGSFAGEYLDLPREVLETAMQVHQRYFPVAAGAGGQLLPYFIGISNTRYHENIRRGYEKVLQARLADARFFFNEDMKLPLETYVDRLSAVVFQEALGSIDDKRRRLVELTRSLAARLGWSAGATGRAERVAHLCKADLVTHMVREFPELQGIMGREYARLSGETETVAKGIYEHYLPRHGGDRLPETAEGALVSLADRIDTLAGCFAVGIQPSGSQDPYALRRQAQGAVAVLLERELDLTPRELVEEALSLLDPVVALEPGRREERLERLMDFFMQRVRFIFQERGLLPEVVDAVLAGRQASPAELFRRASFLAQQLHSPAMKAVITAYNRVANLSRQAGGGAIDRALLAEKEEKELFRCVLETETGLEPLLEQHAYQDCLRLLARLKEPVDRFFDHVMVMVEERALRENRLNLLCQARELFNRMADFSRLTPPD